MSHAMEFEYVDSCLKITDSKAERTSLILSSKWRYLDHVIALEIAWKASWESIPKITSLKLISCILWRAQLIHLSSANNLFPEGVKASLEWNKTLPWWSLRIHAAPTIAVAFLQLAFTLHLTRLRLGGCQEFEVLNVDVTDSADGAFLFTENQSFASSNAWLFNVSTDVWISAYKIELRFFHIIQSNQGIAFLRLSSIFISDIICMITVKLSVRLRGGVESTGKCTVCSISWAGWHWNSTWLIDSRALLQSLHVWSTFKLLEFSLSATARARESPSHKDSYLRKSRDLPYFIRKQISFFFITSYFIDFKSNRNNNNTMLLKRKFSKLKKNQTFTFININNNCVKDNNTKRNNNYPLARYFFLWKWPIKVTTNTCLFRGEANA